jgi:cobalamin biosynthesis protein CobD/CbiB
MQEKIAGAIGVGVVVLFLVVGIIAGLYWLAIQAGTDGARWWAVVATLAIPAVVIITYRLATHAAREHLSGFDRGLTGAQKTVETMGRSLAATASLARTSARPRTANDDLLPKVGTMRLIESQQNTDEVVDL